MEEEKVSEGRKNKKDYFLPISIVIAGIVIALALIYSSGKEAVVNSESDISEKGEISISVNDHILGNKDAEITIFEFSDYECPFCAKFANEVKPLIINEYVDSGKAKFVFRDMVFHEMSPFLSNMSWCAGEQGKYWEVHNHIFLAEAQSETPTKEDILKISQDFGLDSIMLEDCIDNGNYVNDIIEITKSAQQIGIGATPILVITHQNKVIVDSQYFISELKKGSPSIQLEGGVAIVGAQPLEVFKTEIDKLLK